MSDEQRSAIKFCVRNGFSKSKTIDMLLNAYGEKAMKKNKKKTAVYMGYKRFEFEEGRENIKDDQRSGRTSVVRHLTSPPSSSYWIMIGASRSGFLLLQNFSVAIFVSPHVCFILVLILISVFQR